MDMGMFLTFRLTSSLLYFSVLDFLGHFRRTEPVKVFVDSVKQYPCMPDWVTAALEGNVVELMMHPTGSKCILDLAIQFALKIGDHQFSREICRVLKNHVEDLSTDENGSYAIQACIKSSGG
ncbi:uncharacterized protein A4U43_C09F16510 [Asparagus officinalis]|uniref:PUM-HD domain-containing protein n=1 Tax=Asparagus officinalis TaxID=4686 RepID=A0A5P1E880_ASPOF|nr:uncharacterized protein A4U43_C09F16510 [Asparagus officinalis]